MTEEDAIKILNTISEKGQGQRVFWEEDLKNIRIVLNLIQKQQEEIEKKEEVIDEMAEWINKIDSTIFCYKSMCEENCKECVKKYFKRKVEEVYRSYENN